MDRPEPALVRVQPSVWDGGVGGPRVRANSVGLGPDRRAGGSPRGGLRVSHLGHVGSSVEGAEAVSPASRACA